MFYGKGAGSIPTATAIVADLVSIFENRAYIEFNTTNRLSVNKDIKNQYKYYIFNADGSYIIKENVLDSELKNSYFYARVL